jgi:hypothetical protein
LKDDKFPGGDLLALLSRPVLRMPFAPGDVVSTIEAELRVDQEKKKINLTR